MKGYFPGAFGFAGGRSRSSSSSSSDMGLMGMGFRVPGCLGAAGGPIDAQPWESCTALGDERDLAVASFLCLALDEKLVIWDQSYTTEWGFS